MLNVFGYDFMIRAMVAGGIIALVAPVLGNFLVVRRYALIADTLAHVALAGAAISVILGTNAILTSVILSVVVGLIIETLRSQGKVGGESILAIFLSSSLAIVALIVSMAKGQAFNLTGFLFGSITTVVAQDVYLIGLIGGLCLGLIGLCYNALFITSVDEEVAQASGIKTRAINLVLITLTALVVSIALRVVGALLTGALMVIPVMAATRISRSFKQNLVFSVIFGEIATLAGLLASFYLDLAAGGAIVIITLIIFLLTLVVKLS